MYHYGTEYLHRLIDPGQRETTLVYDSVYNLRSVVLPDGSAAFSEANYNSARQLVNWKDARGGLHTVTYVGNYVRSYQEPVPGTSNPARPQTLFVPAPVAAMRLPPNNTSVGTPVASISGDSVLATVRDPEGHVTTRVIDLAGRSIETISPLPQEPVERLDRRVRCFHPRSHIQKEMNHVDFLRFRHVCGRLCGVLAFQR